MYLFQSVALQIWKKRLSKRLLPKHSKLLRVLYICKVHTCIHSCKCGSTLRNCHSNTYPLHCNWRKDFRPSLRIFPLTVLPPIQLKQKVHILSVRRGCFANDDFFWIRSMSERMLKLFLHTGYKTLLNVCVSFWRRTMLFSIVSILSDDLQGNRSSHI